MLSASGPPAFHTHTIERCRVMWINGREEKEDLSMYDHRKSHRQSTKYQKIKKKKVRRRKKKRLFFFSWTRNTRRISSYDIPGLFSSPPSNNPHHLPLHTFPPSSFLPFTLPGEDQVRKEFASARKPKQPLISPSFLFTLFPYEILNQNDFIRLHPNLKTGLSINASRVACKRYNFRGWPTRPANVFQQSSCPRLEKMHRGEPSTGREFHVFPGYFSNHFFFFFPEAASTLASHAEE